MADMTTRQQSEWLLEMIDVSKSFPGVKALDNVNLRVRPHSVHALMGENGAGKSTLLKCLFGIYEKDQGKIFFKGQEINFTSSKEALENGVSMVHQELNLVLQRSVMDNMARPLSHQGAVRRPRQDVSGHQAYLRGAGHRHRPQGQGRHPVRLPDADDRDCQGILL
jgi:ABC-type sugar transport system ATPase subunit